MINKIKRWLSYFFEFHVESAPSEINPHLYVSLKKGRYQLCTAHAIYSFEDKYDNFSKAFAQINFTDFPVKKVLILGFGLGSIPIILEKMFNKTYEFTAVEIDESVLYLANKYAIPQIKSNINFLCADAFAYVMQCEEQFDMICMDVFLDDVIPEHFSTYDFLERLKSLVQPQGMLLYNRLFYNNKDKNATRVFYEKKFQPVFPQGTFLDVNGNWIMMNQQKILKTVT